MMVAGLKVRSAARGMVAFADGCGVRMELGGIGKFMRGGE